MSFFDDDDEPPTAIRAPRDARPRESRPRRVAPSARPRRADQQQLLVRRGGAVGGLLVLIIGLVLGVSGCERSKARKAIGNYGDSVNTIVEDSNVNVAIPFFADLLAASSKNTIDVGVELNQLRLDATKNVSDAQKLKVPSALAPAQTDLLLVLDLREEAVGNVAKYITAALGSSDAPTAIKEIAGQMELVLASDVIYSERVAPLISETIADNKLASSPPAASRWLTDLSWLSPATVATRVTGVTGTGNSGQALAPGTHGHALTGVSVGTNTLATGVVNHIASGSNPTFSVGVTNSSDNAATDVKVEVEVTAMGRSIHQQVVVNKTTPGQTVSVDVQLIGVPLDVPAQVTAIIKKVPGEMNTANNKGVYTAIFSQ